MKFIQILFLVAILVYNVICAKFNYSHALLPVFQKLSVNFTLEIIEKGCFTWTSPSDLISIKPIYVDRHDDCSHKVIITPTSREQRRSSAFVLAEDISTGEVLRCDVILDVIHQLNVLTTTRELYLEEAPETFKMWAFDSQGNAFSTLEGVEFTWKILSQNHRSIDSKVENSWQEVLRFLRFADSPYHEVPKSVEHLENIGLTGSMVLLEGVNTGSARVTANLPYPEYSQLQSIEVDIMVLGNLILDPIDAHILVDDTIQFKIMQLKLGKLEEVPIGNQYYLEIEDNRLATLSGNIATGNVLGRTSVILRDRNIPNHLDNENNPINVPMPRTSLTITEAKQISLNLLPNYNWVAVVGERQEIAVDLMSRDGNKIILGTKFKIQTTFDESLFYPINHNKNGTRIYGEALRSGTSGVSASFQNLKAAAELSVYNPIDLNPQVVILPYDANNPKGQYIQFIATGGTGSFVWSSLHQQIVSIDGNGRVFTKPENLQEPIDFQSDFFHESAQQFGQIKVAVTQNAKISKTADLFFLPPVKLEIVKYNFETALNDLVEIHVAIYAKHNKTRVPYFACDNLNLKLDFTNEIFRNENSPNGNTNLANKACRILSLRATALGTSQLKISYNFMDNVLRDEVTLVVFEKLDILNPTTNEIVLPIGTTRNVIYVNGPQRIFTIEAELVRKIRFDKALVDIGEIHNEFTKDHHIFNVLCKAVGETMLTLEIYNSLPVQNFVPYQSQFITKIFCVNPRFLNLYTTEELRTSCPMKTKNSLMYVQGNGNNLEIGIEVLDAQNRKLMNVSSLEFEWKFSHTDGHVEENVIHRRESEDEILTGVTIPIRDYLKVTVPNAINIAKIEGAVTSYANKILNSFSIQAESPEFRIQKVKPSHPSVLEITQTVKSDGMLQYKAKLLNPLAAVVDDEPISIKIISSLTQQIVDILIQSQNVTKFGFIISALIMLAVTIWAFVFCFNMKTTTNPQEIDSFDTMYDSSKYINRNDLPMQKEILTRVVDMGLKFKCREKVVSAESDAADFSKLMSKICEKEFPTRGIGLAKLIDNFETELLPFCTNWASPYAMAFNDNGNSLAAIAGDVLATLLNQNVINWRPCSPIATVIEMTVLNWLRQLIGYPCEEKLLHPANVAGVITSGGVASNTIALLIARENALPETMVQGIKNSEDIFVIVPNGIDHYSSRLAVGWLGLGEANVIRAPTLNFAYDLRELRDLLKNQKKLNRKPIMLVCYAGDSRSLTCDNFIELRNICDEYGLWMHVDGCQGTQLVFSKRLKKEKLQGIQLADSITMDPHKVLNVPYSVSVLLVREQKHMELIRRAEDIITGEEHSFGQLTPFFGSRAFMSLKLYFLFKNLGLDGLEEIIERRCQMANVVSDEIAKIPRLLQINHKVDMNSVIFMYFPREILSQLSSMISKENKLTVVSVMNDINVHIQAKLFSDGDIWLHTFLIPDLANAVMFSEKDTTPNLRPLRFMSGNPIINSEHIKHMLSRVVAEGDELLRNCVKNMNPNNPLYKIFSDLKLSTWKSKLSTNSTANVEEIVPKPIAQLTFNSGKGYSLRNNIVNIPVNDNHFLTREEFYIRKTQLMLRIRRFCSMEFVEPNESYFVVVYGSYAYGYVKPRSDLDIVFFCEDEHFSIERRNRIICFVKQLHNKYDMQIDNEIPYESKILITYSFLKSACQGDGIITSTSDGRQKWMIPEMKKTKEYLTSRELLLRFFIGFFVNQNFLVCGSVHMYNKCKGLAARNLVRAVISINGRKQVNSNSVTQDFCLSPSGQFGDYFLGFSNREPFISHLLEFLEQTLDTMNLHREPAILGTSYVIQCDDDLKREYFNDS